MLKVTRSLSTLITLFSLGTILHAADLATGVTGVVRDPHGTPQMGVFVELLRGGVVATAFTDLQGRYHIEQITPGVYDLRTSATLFLPTLHRSLRLRAGAGSTVNLTLTGLFDETGWLSLPHRSGKGDIDDWKWTLRSPANRPMLRVLDDDADADASATPAIETRATPEHHATTLSSAKFGGLGAEGPQLSLEIGGQSRDHRASHVIRMSESASRQGNTVQGMSVVAVRDTGKGQGIQRRVTVGVRSAPQVWTQAGAGITVVEVDSVQRMELGSMAALEIGGQTQAIHSSGAPLIVMHPFVQASAPVGHTWLIRYQYATSPGSTGLNSFNVGEALTRVPTVVQGSAGTLTETGAHQECGAGRSVGRGRIEVAGFRDREERAALTGQLRRPAAGAPTHVGADMMVDAVNGSFRTLVPGFTTAGIRVQAEAPIGSRGKVLAAYLNGGGLAERLGGAPGSSFTSRRASAMYVALQQEIPKTGTQISASYRWQPSSMLTTVGRYEFADVDPYLGLHVVQALSMGRSTGWHTELVIDVANPLEEGYRQSGDPAQEALYVSALREMRAGLAVSF